MKNNYTIEHVFLKFSIPLTIIVSNYEDANKVKHWFNSYRMDSDVGQWNVKLK